MHTTHSNCSCWLVEFSLSLFWVVRAEIWSIFVHCVQVPLTGTNTAWFHGVSSWQEFLCFTLHSIHYGETGGACPFCNAIGPRLGNITKHICFPTCWFMQSFHCGIILSFSLTARGLNRTVWWGPNSHAFVYACLHVFMSMTPGFPEVFGTTWCLCECVNQRIENF